MNSKHVLPLKPPSFALLVKYLKIHSKEADIFEIDLDSMRVKGDLAVIRTYFKKPMIAKSMDLEMLRKGVKAGMDYVDIDCGMVLDAEFTTLLKNKNTQVIRSYHNWQETPKTEELNKILAQMEEQRTDSKRPELLKLAVYIQTKDDEGRLLGLLNDSKYAGRLIICGMGDKAKNARIQAPILGSVFYYAPLKAEAATAAGQITKAELEQAFKLV